ncbi:Bug family tripartite tricarboxylate transporter substrate binding protein [Paracandidimonas soli]|uniref:Tripartite-type tricarboxylate transporter receptor subunit TctC n=1 Tax=Paracandidimonas soli TaxID=1917182 RepID=A0A4R3USN9_9BURK|nr:tripartite tricarboxylate transporter substrate binding protein [Paracandidimonas soli]TCU93911.1 tripartite-type tricarboxylate transporter receptor subunit TctC [Paracandidimonas soli]
MGQNIGQPLVIENKAGASAAIGTEYVARSPADGYTLLLANLPVMAINELQFPKLPYNAKKDLEPVVMLADQPYIIAVHPSTGVKTLGEFIDLAKKSPDKFTFGSASSSTYLAGELFKIRAGIQMTHVPYKGSAPAINDLLGGHITLLQDPVITLLPHVKADKVVALAVTAPKRVDIAPEIPSYTEAGLVDMNITSWQGIVAPAGTPKEIVEKLNAEFNKALQDSSVIEQLQKQGVTPVGGSAQQFADFVQQERERWSDIARQANFKPESM